jgi:hypothetical protein
LSASLADMIEAEALAAEAEDETDENGDNGEPTDEDEDETGEEESQEEEPSALAPIGEAEIRKAEKASEAQRRKLAGILGESYVAHECIFCAALGFTPELPPVGAVLTIVETEEGVGYTAEPPPPEIPLLEAPDKERCPECDGWGEVLSGSRNSHGMVTPCSKCQGNGWVMVPRTEPPAAHVPDAGFYQAPPVPIFSPSGAPDAWGRPSGHQHYGRAPADIPG